MLLDLYLDATLFAFRPRYHLSEMVYHILNINSDNTFWNAPLKPPSKSLHTQIHYLVEIIPFNNSTFKPSRPKFRWNLIWNTRTGERDGPVISFLHTESNTDVWYHRVAGLRHSGGWTRGSTALQHLFPKGYNFSFIQNLSSILWCSLLQFYTSNLSLSRAVI
jgi:hypothetical protein